MKKVEFKAEYVQPQTEVVEVEMMQMIADSCSSQCPDDGGEEIECFGDDE